MFAAVASFWHRVTRAPPRVLFIDDLVPDPRTGAGAPRAYALLRAIIAAGSPLTVLPRARDFPGAVDPAQLLPEAEIVRGQEDTDLAPFLLEHGKRFDLIIVSRPHNMNAFRLAAGADGIGAVPVVYDAEALFAVRDAIRQEVMGEPLPAGQFARALADEIALADGLSMVLAVNHQTAAAFRAGGHADVRILGHALVPRPASSAFDRRDGFLFVGPAHADDTPNSDSLVWFIDHVLPGIRAAMDREVPFVVAGMQRSQLVATRADASATTLGVVADLGEAFASARVFVAPTRFASGLPLKVQDAAAHGVPAVITPVLAEQLGWHHEREVLVAASPRDFAAQCLRLHGDRDLWERMRACALRRVARDCDPLRFNRVVRAMLAHAASRPRRAVAQRRNLAG